MIKYIVEKSGNLYPADGAAYLSVFDYMEWLAQVDGSHTHPDYLICSFDSIPDVSQNGTIFVPIGSVDFCNAVLEKMGVPPMQPLNIPEPLLSPSFLGRTVYPVVTHGQIMELFELGKTGRKLFIKPASRVKDFESMVVTKQQFLDASTLSENLFFASELLPKVGAEWRAFIYRGEIKGIRPYIFDEWLVPDRQAVLNMVRAMEKDPSMPSAYTLDVAVLEDSRTVLVEAHNFLACGLYGFESKSLPFMAKAATEWELRRKKQS